MLRSATVKVYTVCITERYECEVDSMSKLIEPHLIKLHNYDARCCINSKMYTVCITERYFTCGEDTYALRLTSELVDLRARYAKWIQ